MNAPAENVLIIILQLVSGLEAAEFYSRVSMIQVIGTILFEIILGTYFNHSIKFRFRYGQISQSFYLTFSFGITYTIIDFAFFENAQIHRRIT